jgi:hypothetical protein
MMSCRCPELCLSDVMFAPFATCHGSVPGGAFCTARCALTGRGINDKAVNRRSVIINEQSANDIAINPLFTALT